MAILITFNQKTYRVGDFIKVNYKIKEGDKERLQAFDGIIIAIKGKIGQRTFTLKKEATDGISVERIFRQNSPWIDSITKLRSAKKTVRRSKLYFLRNSKTKKL